MATVYDSSIDNEQINGAFALAVDVRFDDLSAGPNQKVFDLNNGDGVDNIWFGQVGASNDVEFVIVNGGVEYRVVAENAIVEGEYATFRVGVDPTGTMRIAKNTDLLIEEDMGLAAVPADVDRLNYQIGESSDAADADLSGVVLNLKLANYADTEQLGAYSNESPCAVTGEATCLCDKLYPDNEIVPGEGGPTFLPTTDAEGDGEWSAVQSLGVIAIHSIVLPDGKVLSFGTNENGVQGAQFVYTLYDPATGIDKILPNTTPTDIFCSNMSIDPFTGNVIIMGGDERGEGGTTNHGVNDVVIFDYRTETIRTAEQGEMEYARWYGTTLNLPNGEILHIGGKNDTGGVSRIPEVFNWETGFRTLTGANMTDLGNAGYFPHAWVNSRGEVIIIESGGRDIFRLDTSGVGSYEKIGVQPFGAAVQQPAIMFDQDMIARIDNNGGVWVANIADAVPTFTQVAQLSGGRYDGGMTMLPDGRVAITGGGTQYNTLGAAVYTVEIWDPSDNSIVQEADAAVARLYHSSHVLLPDGTIFVGGGGAPGPLVNTNFEIYAPSYLYGPDGELADRPDILSAPSNVAAGATFQMTVDDASAIDKVTVSKSGAMTHGKNSDARFLSLDFTVIDAQTIEVSTPNNLIMTPGVWMLFTVDNNGVPSQGEMLGVDMAPLVETGDFDITDMSLAVYGVDDDPINGAFELTVEARFDDVAGGSYQRVFDFGNGQAADNIILGQIANTPDMYFAIFDGDTQYRIIAQNAIVEGVVAKWTVSVDASGYMRMWKNDVLVAEGQGVAPNDVDRTSNLVGKSNWSADDDLEGEVRFLEIVNEGDLPEYVHLGLPRATLVGPDSVVEGDAGETGQIVYTLQLDAPAQNIVSADVVIEGDATGPAQVVIPAGQQSAQIILTYQGDDAYEIGETVSVSLQNLSQAWTTDGLSVATAIENDDPVPQVRDITPGFVLASDATRVDDAIRLTTAANNQTGAASTPQRIDFTSDFELNASVYLGAKDGADGLGFVFHNDPNGSAAIGATGGGMGVSGILNGFGFEIDSYQNSGEIANDHFTFIDSETQAKLSAEVDLGEVEDGATHSVRVLWSAANQSMTVFFDDVQVGALDAAQTAPYLGDGAAYLTIGAATGGLNNEHRVENVLFEGLFEGEAQTPPALSIADAASQSEGAAGQSGALIFTVSLDKAWTDAVTADIAIDGAATGPASVTIPAGETSVDIAVAFDGDDVDEPDETITVTLSNLQNASAGDLVATGVILDDDLPPPPALSIADAASQSEGAAGQSGALIFTVSLDKAWTDAVTADIAIDGAATGPASVTIPAGETSVDIAVAFDGDDVDEPDETITVTLSNLQNASAGVLVATGVILDDDEPGQASTILADEDFEAGASGWTDNTTTDGGAPFSTFLGRYVGSGVATEKTFAPPAGTDRLVIEFDYLEIDSWDGDQGDAMLVSIDGVEIIRKALYHVGRAGQSGADPATSGVTNGVAWSVTPLTSGLENLGFAGQSYASDQIHRVVLTIDNPAGPVTLGVGSSLNQGLADESYGLDNVLVTAFDDDGQPIAPQLTIAPPADAQEGGPGETGTLTFVASLDQPSATGDVTATVSIAGGATGPTSVTIPQGQTSADIVVSFDGDAVEEPDETITVALSDVQGADPGATLSASAQILDDDAPPPATSPFEFGRVATEQPTGDDWFSVSFTDPIANAVVVMGPLTDNGGQPAFARIRNVTEDGFEFQIEEWAYLDGYHVAETVGWMAMSEGAYTLPDGRVVVAGETTADTSFSSVDLTGFDSTPVVFTQQVDAVDPDPAVTRVQNVSTSGFEVKLREEEAADDVHAAEAIGYIAIEAGSGAGLTVATTPDAVTHADYSVALADSTLDSFVFLAEMQTNDGNDTAGLRYSATPTGVDFFVDEEQSADSETNHTTEVVGYLAADEGVIELTPDDPFA